MNPSQARFHLRSWGLAEAPEVPREPRVSDTWNPRDILFIVLSRVQAFGPDVQEGVKSCVVLVHREYWKKNHHIEDRHITKFLPQEVLSAGLAECTESVFEGHSPPSKMRDKLLRRGCVEDPELYEKMKDAYFW